jgi:hypothetical protein
MLVVIIGELVRNVGTSKNLTNLLEEFIALLNRSIFLREFSFSKNQFIPDDSTQLEFADHVVWIDDIVMIFQLKQRDEITNHTEDDERKWFNKKVIKKGSSQIRDTLNYLRRYSTITVTNQRGHKVKLDVNPQQKITKLIVYVSSKYLPKDCWQVRYYESSTGGGFIHVLPWNDYLGISQYLITPMEISAYFQFREYLIRNQLADHKQIASEKALVGYFLSGSEEPPEEKHSDYLRLLKQEDFDISRILGVLGDRINRSTQDEYDPTDYYIILKEFVKLHRSELKEIKKRLILCINAVGADEFMSPTRIVTSRRCGFVFVPLKSEVLAYRKEALMNLVFAAKYDLQLDLQIGISFAKAGQEWLIDFCRLDYPWEYDKELDERLQANNPFPPMTNTLGLDYSFED